MTSRKRIIFLARDTKQLSSPYFCAIFSFQKLQQNQNYLGFILNFITQQFLTQKVAQLSPPCTLKKHKLSHRRFVHFLFSKKESILVKAIHTIIQNIFIIYSYFFKKKNIQQTSLQSLFQTTFFQQQNSEEIMKTSTLKFKELFDKTYDQMIQHQQQIINREPNRENQSTIKNQSIMKQSMISTNYSILSQNSNKRNRSTLRPHTARGSGSQKQNAFQVISHIYIKKDGTKDHSYLMNSEFIKIIKEDILKCLMSRTYSEVIEFCGEFQLIQEILEDLSKVSVRDASNFLLEFESDINQRFQHRISRIIFYCAFNKYLDCTNTWQSLKRELQIWQLCEYYCRHLSIFTTTLQICKRIMDIFIILKNYDEARLYGRKCLRMAVWIKNSDVEFQVIEKLKVVSYFQGVLNKYPEIHITQQERTTILHTYSLLDDQPQIKGLSDSDSKGNHPDIPFDAQFLADSEALENVSENVTNFIRNMTQIRKELTYHSQNIKQTIKKVEDIGKLRKYFKDGNYITLQPRSRNTVSRNQSQIFLTNLGRNLNHQSKSSKFFRQYLPKYIKLISELVQFCEGSYIIKRPKTSKLKNFKMIR